MQSQQVRRSSHVTNNAASDVSGSAVTGAARDNSADELEDGNEYSKKQMDSGERADAYRI